MMSEHQPVVAAAWTRWMAFARKAAEVQSNVSMGILYWVAFVPLALLQRRLSDPLEQRASGPPAWRPRETSDADSASARRQF